MSRTPCDLPAPAAAPASPPPDAPSRPDAASPTDGGPAYRRLADRLRDEIEAGALRPGERLPSETRLAAEAGVSRSTVRESLRTLQEAGLIERASPRIMVVSHRPPDTVYREVTHALRRHKVTFAHLTEALLLLEPEVTRLATERCDDGAIRMLEDMVLAQEDCLEDYGEWSRLDQEFHLAIAEMSANPALIVARAPITELLMPVLRQFMNSRLLTEHATRYHRRILFEIQQRDPELAAAVTSRHIRDFRIAWEKAGLDVNAEVFDLDERLLSRR